ncbi:MAG: aminomethyl-transferring glycine dehydrogenase subunit GcvPA [Planctomycetes bacterium]|nr:aminomethyl-transferring glycine dehydrogenase subunit GcvPA [Planctomycetota bacterium]
MDFTPHTEEDIQRILKDINLKSLDDLFDVIPKDIRYKDPGVPAALTEQEIIELLSEISSKNKIARTGCCFLGAGKYKHYVPAVIDALVSRGEFLTSYTPYQPEVSQGTLQLIFEYQTIVSELTGLPVTNASHYDGATALAEAIGMCLEITGKRKIIIPEALNPNFLHTVRTYHSTKEIEFITLKHDNGAINPAKLVSVFTDDVAAIVVQNPNFYGVIEDIAAIVAAANRKSIMTIVSTYPVSLALLQSPGDAGAQICVGDGQSLGCYLEYGGPSFGFIATTTDFLRFLPGRIVGQTVDRNDKRVFVLTLQTREQHIRRERATSNICTNQSLYALRSACYMSLLGADGLRDIALQCVERSHVLADKLSRISGVKLPFSSPFFNEFVVEVPTSAHLICERMYNSGYLAGHCLDEKRILVCATEENSYQEIDTYVEFFGKCLK